MSFLSFFFSSCYICRTTACWDPEILLPWQRDVTASPLSWHVTTKIWVVLLVRSNKFNQEHFPDLGSDASSCSTDFLRSFLGRFFAGKLVVASQGRGGGGTPGNFWWGCTARFSKSWPYLRPKTSFFTPVFRPGLNPYPLLDLAFKKLCPHYLGWNSNRKDFLKSMSKSFISLSFLLMWNWNNKFVRTFP